MGWRFGYPTIFYSVVIIIKAATSKLAALNFLLISFEISVILSLKMALNLVGS